MIDEGDRPDPDKLLRVIEQGEKKRGQLRVFIGMAAGVGKTYAMLKAAHRLQNDGVNVLIGIVETHGRAETAALISGLKFQALVKREYRDLIFQEMDLDGILEARPTVVLVDELAHTNIPGSRHEKRYQDVEELLGAGISVYTTMNIQHLESRKALVEEIADIRVHETVPDAFLQMADEINLIDIDPDALIHRMDSGNIYDDSKRHIAKDHFFTKVNLTALRELVLRYAAGHVERNLINEQRLFGTSKTFRDAPRLEVAVFASPFSESLLRWTKLIADSMGGTWIAVYIDDGTLLSTEEKDLLSKNILLVGALGGELVTTVDADPVSGLLRVAKHNNVSMIVVGKSQRSLASMLLGKRNVTTQLLKESGEIDVCVISASKRLSWKKPVKASIEEKLLEPFPLRQAGMMFAFLCATWLLNSFLLRFSGYWASGFVFLLGVFLGALVLNRAATFSLALLSGVVWNYFFIPPLYTIAISKPEDVMMFIAFFVVAFVMGTLTHKLRLQKRRVLQREERAQTLFRVTRQLSAAKSRVEIFAAITDALSVALQATVSILTTVHGDRVKIHVAAGNFKVNEKDLAVAAWVISNSKIAGRNTETLSNAGGTYFPLLVNGKAEAVIAVGSTTAHHARQEIESLVETFSQQAAVALEREDFRARAIDTAVLVRTQQLYHALFDSVSHELKTPLSAIHGATSALLEELQDLRMRELAGIVSESSDRLLQTVENILNMSRVESGVLKPNFETQDSVDLINGPLRELEPELARHLIITHIKTDLPHAFCDIGLTQIAIRNILRNAARYTPPGSEIRISTFEDASFVVIEIRDNGPGLPLENPSKVFDKFFRVKPERTGGLGLGLSIARYFIEVQDGKLEAENSGGAVFRIFLPKRST